MKIRRTHRYLGLFIGIQFIMWTVSGLYFSWTDLDEIHGDQFRKHHLDAISFENLKSPTELDSSLLISSLALREIAGEPYYLVNSTELVHAVTGEKKQMISETEALSIAERNMKEGLEVRGIGLISATGKQHEYRGSKLPAYVISYNGTENLRAYVSAQDGTFRTVRHRDWRWFDFLWMTHTMDYEGRDNFNNLALRIFSLMGLFTVFSGFLLWFISSPRMRKVTTRKNAG